MAYALWHMDIDRWGTDGGEAPPMDHKGGGIESRYDPRMAREILRRILNGQTVRQVAADPQMPSYATIYHWVRMHDDFGARWRWVREEMARARVQERVAREAARAFREATKLVVDGKRWWKSGQRSTYSKAAAEAFCDRVARGETLTSICARTDMPSMKAVYGWLRREPEFRAMYVDARDWALSVLEAQAAEIADRALGWGLTPKSFAAIKRRVAKVEGRIGRMTAKTYRTGSLIDP